MDNFSLGVEISARLCYNLVMGNFSRIKHIAESNTLVMGRFKPMQCSNVKNGSAPLTQGEIKPQ
ncbi:MAG: hypothetical protein K2O14_04005 [Oscillospiraceae bacterium]|nr:hypothetical protein [Oscillospiraceae bacterium]